MKTQQEVKSSLKNATTARRNISKLSRHNSEGMLDSVIDSALNGVQTVGKSVTGVFKAENVLPIAIGSFILGAAAGALGSMYLPKLLKSDLVTGLGTRLSQATSAVGQTLNQAKDVVINKVKEATTDRVGKSTLASDGSLGINNNTTGGMSPTRLA